MPQVVPTVRVLGKLTVAAADGGSVPLSLRPRKLLASFVAAGPEGTSGDRLAESLWGDDLPARWQPTLRMAISRLRSAIETALVSDGGGHYRLDLPVVAVDGWWLLDLADDEERPVTDADLRRALAGEAFGDVDAGYLVDNARIGYANAQSAIAKRFCVTIEQIDDGEVALLVNHQRAVAPFQEDLILAIAACLHRSHKTATAASYLDEVLATHEAELGTSEPALLAYRASLDAPVSATAGEARIEPLPARVGRGPHVPPLLEHAVGEPCCGRDEELVELTSGRSHVLLGSLGSGKTRLLAAIAEAAVARSDHVSFVGADSSRTPYGPFLAAFPELRSDQFVGLDRVDPVVDGGDSSAVRTADLKRTLLVVDHLDQLGDDGRHWLLVDDIHAFDEASRRLVGFLAAAKTRRPLTIVVAGRNDDGHEWLSPFEVGLRRAGFGSISLGPLGPAEMEAMLRGALPNLMVSSRHELARALFERSGGLPAAARVLVASIDPAMLTFDDAQTYEPEGWTQPTLDLPRPVLQVGAAAAVLGNVFAVDGVMALVDQPEDAVGAALEELWDREIVVDGKDASELRFANTLLRQALVESTPSFRLAELHARAAAHVDDLHARADHEAAAVPIVPAAQAAQSLLKSAHLFMDEGSWLDAVAAIRRSNALLDCEPEITTLILLARALDLSGAVGTGPRKVAFGRALASQRWELALEAALSGLPEAERPDGDPDRIAMLESIPAEHLDERPRFERSLALARLCALNGSPTEARDWLREGQALANNAPRLVRSEIASWSLTHHVEPNAFEFSDEVVASASGHERMHVLQRQAISSLESGSVVDAVVLHERFAALAAEVGDPAGIWQGKVLAASLAFDRGRWSAAEELSHEAEEYGERHAMQQAALVCLGQSFCRKLITGEQGQLVERFEEMPVNTDASTIAMAARALSLAARGRRDQAWSGVAATVQDALDRPRPSALVVLAILAGLVRDAADPETVERVRQRLAAFGDRSLVVGYGIATAGPVQRQLALLSNDPEETIEHLRDAVLVADRSGALTWQVVTRLGLARAAGTQAPVAEAASLAADTELESLLKAALPR